MANAKEKINWRKKVTNTEEKTKILDREAWEGLNKVTIRWKPKGNEDESYN